MTKLELLNKLQNLPDNAEVVIRDSDYDSYTDFDIAGFVYHEGKAALILEGKDPKHVDLSGVN